MATQMQQPGSPGASGASGTSGRPVDGEATLGALFATASRDLSSLVRDEVALAKAELRRDAKNGAKGGAMFGAAAFLVLLAVILLSIAAAYGLVAAGLHPGWAFLIVAAVYLIVAGVLALVGKKAVAKVGPPKRTIRTSKETAAFLKRRRSPNATTSTRT
jgi:Putative Actinobacterial Holin-X, holin superfamily III